MELKVRTFEPSEWQTYRDIRLAALKESPTAFGSVYEDAVQYSKKVWQERLTNARSDIDLPLIALVDEQAAGLCWARIENPEYDFSNLFSMWVAPQFRKRGLSRLLMNRAIEWSKARGKTAMELDVTVGNTAAEQLYLSLGFHFVGEPVPLRSNCDLMERSMRLDLQLLTE